MLLSLNCLINHGGWYEHDTIKNVFWHAMQKVGKLATVFKISSEFLPFYPTFLINKIVLC